MAAEMNRRGFHRLAIAAGLAAAASGRAMGQTETQERAEAMPLGAMGWCPNNAALPTLFYKAALANVRNSRDPAAAFEEMFTRNGWPPQWRNGVYTFHHYHSTAHEVLGFAAGSAELVLGGPGGRLVTVKAGDVLLLPTGTGHCEISKSADFLVVGAYPPGQTWDICRAAPDGGAAARMHALPFPMSDPVYGGKGPLLQHWRPA